MCLLKLEKDSLCFAEPLWRESQVSLQAWRKFTPVLFLQLWIHQCKRCKFFSSSSGWQSLMTGNSEKRHWHTGVKANAVMWEFQRSLVTKWDISNAIKFSVFNFFFPILIYDHKTWATTEKCYRCKIQTVEMGLLRRIRDATRQSAQLRNA